jgi:SNF2 family DNA or RNA helicase
LIPLLPAHRWNTSYRHDDGDLVELFYVPVLSCAVQYDRLTGYFSADALALAARGIERLISAGGKMRLVVGCTLEPEEVQAIEAGYELREQVAASLCRIDLTPPDATARRGLEALAWMVASGRLDVKVAVPIGADGKPASAPGIYHEKVGIITDREGNRLSFSGSINETRGGWVNNRESFHVHCSWDVGREWQHVDDEVEAFARLWEDRSKSTKVFEFPEAARRKLLEFLPGDDRIVAAPASVEPTSEPFEAEQQSAPELTADEKRRIVWAYIAHAARMWNGVRVGEVTSAVEPWPHQLHTFARMLESWPCRLLLSDEVGLGKTISAGLLIRQAWLAGLARRILLLVPKAVIVQWQNELFEKFNLNVPIYDGQRLVWRAAYGWQGPSERKVGRNEWHQTPLVLCSSHLARRRDRAAELLASDPWDLVLLDEAHHARRKAAGTPLEGGPNALLRLMQQLQARTKALLLLTATPMQVAPVEIWDLLSLLGLPAKWEASSENFVRYFQLAAGNPSQDDFEWLCAMFRDVEAQFGPVGDEWLDRIRPNASRLDRQRALKALRDKSGIPLKRLDLAGRQLALDVMRRFSPVHHRMARSTRDLLREYHRRGLLEAPIPTREVKDLPVELSPGERALYTAVEDYISTTYNKAQHSERAAVGFVMTIYRRRLASSFAALKQTLLNRLTSLAGEVAAVDEEDVSLDELEEDVMAVEDAQVEAQAGLLAEEKDEINRLLRLIAQLGTDSKARTLRDELRVAWADGYDSAIVFTHYTDTMNYLKEFLAGELPEVPIACYSSKGGARRDSGGFWNECSKESIKLALKNKSVRLLVATDAAGEGLNLQFCGVVVNYDLPWNPMKIEQRIGRIDRIGQKYRTIRVINLAYKDTVEADVYFAAGSRINLFQGIVGKLQPILSRLPQEFKELTLEPSERREAAKQQFLARFERREREARQSPYDIDEMAQAALQPPRLPEPAITLAQIDAALNHRDIRPADMHWEPLDPGSYGMALPGMAERVRATTVAEVFDDHCESHVFLSPGGQLFDRIAGVQRGVDDAGELVPGHYWLVEPADGSNCELLTIAADGPRRVESLSDLLDSFQRIAAPAVLDASSWPHAKLHRLG